MNCFRLSFSIFAALLISQFAYAQDSQSTGSVTTIPAEGDAFCSGDGDFSGCRMSYPENRTSSFYVTYLGSPTWQNATLRWSYNPANQPGAFGTDATVSLIQGYMARWSAVCGIHFEYLGLTQVSPTSNDGSSVIGWSYANGDDAYTRYYSSGLGYYVDADIRIDPARVTQVSQYGGLIDHEIGHAFGLDHSNVAAAIMFANPYHPYAYQEVLNADDIAGCVSLYGTPTVGIAAGWNLIGNSSSGALDVASAFNDGTKITTVWKWIAPSAKWAFYSPSLAGQALTDYANGKGFDVLTTINGGEGFWVNAKVAFTAQLPAGTPITSTSFQTMASGWNLINVGDGKTPSQFGTVTPLTTLWTWDASLTNWYFYASSLDTAGTLSSYIASKGYLDFGNKVLGPTTGFWVNKP